jgi:geranylgeranyl pyrophosphate synthase
MAPVFMVTLAYQISLENSLSTPRARIRAALELDCGFNEEQCYHSKSAALYGAATKMGGILAGAGEEDAGALHAAGLDLGLAYQLLDDVADVVAGIAEVGKEGGMDRGKRTAIDLLGLEGTRRQSQEFQERSLAHLALFGPRADWLRHAEPKADAVKLAVNLI